MLVCDDFSRHHCSRWASGIWAEVALISQQQLYFLCLCYPKERGISQKSPLGMENSASAQCHCLPSIPMEIGAERCFMQLKNSLFIPPPYSPDPCWAMAQPGKQCCAQAPQDWNVNRHVVFKTLGEQGDGVLKQLSLSPVTIYTIISVLSVCSCCLLESWGFPPPHP